MSLPVRVTPVALVAVTVRTSEFPAVICGWLDVSVTVGFCGGVTVTVTAFVTVPPAPVAVAV